MCTKPARPERLLLDLTRSNHHPTNTIPRPAPSGWACRAGKGLLLPDVPRARFDDDGSQQSEAAFGQQCQSPDLPQT